MNAVPLRPAGGTAGHTAPAMAVLHAAVGSLPGIGLAELVDQASLQTRVDRKYAVTMPTVTTLLAGMGDLLAALQIDGRRVSAYRSTYFDTADLLCFRDHRQGRRRRFKVRSRCYLDSGACLLEVKAVGPRGHTIKHRTEYPTPDAGRLTSQGRAFADAALDRHPAVWRLRPSVTTDYHRATLFDPASGSRITIDVGLEFSGTNGTIAAPPDTVIVETKSIGRPGPADAVLRRLGARPVSVSKYCVGVALLHPELRANRWHRLLHRKFVTDG